MRPVRTLALLFVVLGTAACGTDLPTASRSGASQAPSRTTTSGTQPTSPTAPEGAAYGGIFVGSGS